jgi:hypothetical protein
MTPTRCITSVSLCVAIMLGCSPKIQEFIVEPRRICVGDSVRISFKTRGTPHLMTARRGGPVTDTTTYKIVAEAHGKTAYSTADVITYTPMSEPMLAFTTDTLGSDSLIGRDTLSSSTWPDFLRVEGVSGGSNRLLLVRHAGKEATVSSGPNPTWRGLTAGGAWEVRSVLKPAEKLGNPTSPPPSHLYLKLSLMCRASGAEP